MLLPGNIFSQKLSGSDQQKAKIDSTFKAYENAGFDTGDSLKYIYHFSDRDSASIMELFKGLARDTIEAINLYEKDRRWHLTAFENKIYSRESMFEKEKKLRRMLYFYKVNDYHGFSIAPADINIAAVPNDQFLPFIMALDDHDLYSVGLRLDKIKNYQRSLFVFDELLKREYKPDTSHYKMGAALIGTHEYVKGIEHWQKAIALNPAYLEVHIELGKIFYENSHWHEAYRQFLEAYRLDQHDDVILYHLAKSMIKVERYKEAYTIIRRAVKLNPKNIYAKGVLKDMKSPYMRKLRKKSVY